jgi:hypothetical protein
MILLSFRGWNICNVFRQDQGKMPETDISQTIFVYYNPDKNSDLMRFSNNFDSVLSTQFLSSDVEFVCAQSGNF